VTTTLFEGVENEAGIGAEASQVIIEGERRDPLGSGFQGLIMLAWVKPQR
jgi:hypothetical protein